MKVLALLMVSLHRDRNGAPAGRRALAPLPAPASVMPRAFAIALAAALLAAILGSPAAHAQTGSLFPEPFRVEHHAEIDHGDGELFVGDTVIDTYGGSWIVSQRPDGSRLILDLARRELTEVRPSTGTYSTLAFGRLAEVSERLRLAQGLLRPDDLRSDSTPTAQAQRISAGRGLRDGDSAGTTDGELEVVDVTGGPSASRASRTSLDPGRATATTGVVGPLRHVRVARRNAAPTDAGLEVWVDPNLRLTPAALEAIESFESEVLAVRLGADRPTSAGSATLTVTAARELATAPSRYLAAARRQTGGAFPMRTVRPLVPPPDRAALAGMTAATHEGTQARLATTDDPAPLGSVADVVTKLQRLDRFPSELLEIPEGLRRVPHPLEVTASYLEDERERDAALAGSGETLDLGQEGDR